MKRSTPSTSRWAGSRLMVALWATAAPIAACTGNVDGSSRHPDPSRPSEPAAPGTPGTPAAPGTPGVDPDAPGTPPIGDATCWPPADRVWQLTPQQVARTVARALPTVDPVDVERRLARLAASGEPYAADPSLVSGGPWANEVFKVVSSGVLGADLSEVAPQLAEGEASAFLRGAGRRLLRGLLNDERAGELSQAFAATAGDRGPTEASRYMLRRLLLSPEFLYRWEVGSEPTDEPGVRALGAHALATQIAYTLTDAPPDDELWAAAEDGSLTSPSVHETHVRRLLDAPPPPESVSLPNDNAVRNVSGLLRFFREWMDADSIRTSPHFEESRLRQRRLRWLDNEAMLFLRHSLWEADGSLRFILNANVSTYSNTLADFYGFERDENATSVDIRPTTQGRRGLLMQAGFLTTHHNTTSRGLFIREMLLCTEVEDPLEADVDLPGLEEQLEAERGENLSPRDVRALHLEDPSCSGCHTLIDPLGFPLDGFAPGGTARETWDGLPIDTQGYVTTDQEPQAEVNGPAELMQYLSESSEVRACFVRQMYHFVHGRAPTTTDTCYLERLQRNFEESGGNVRELFVDMMTGDEMRLRSGAPL